MVNLGWLSAVTSFVAGNLTQIVFGALVGLALLCVYLPRADRY